MSHSHNGRKIGFHILDSSMNENEEKKNYNKFT